MSDSLFQWSQKWGISQQCLDDLRSIVTPVIVTVQSGPQATSEGATQANIRLASPQYGALWRNNNGACVDDTGRHIRYGLANDSKRINKVFKSSDLIGYTRVEIKPHHMGQIMAVFTAIEVKAPGWKLTPSDERGHGQANFLTAVTCAGGIAAFATCEQHYLNAIEEFGL